MKGDGTLSGHVHIYLQYTLSAVSIILSWATIWMGCNSISKEIGNRHIHLIVTKPVTRTHIWLGKWVGLLWVNAGLLIISGGLIYGGVLWTVRPSQLSADEYTVLHEEIMTSRKLITPDTRHIDEQAQTLAKERTEKENMPHNPLKNLYGTIRHELFIKKKFIGPFIYHPGIPNNTPSFFALSFFLLNMTPPRLPDNGLYKKKIDPIHIYLAGSVS